MSTKQLRSRFTRSAELPLRLIIVVSMLISALMLPLGTVSAVTSNRVMCENDASLIGCWRMEEGSGTALKDGGATPFNDGTLTNNPTWVPGYYGQGLGFNGSNQYVIIPDENSLDITSAITLAAWVKPGKLATQNIIKKAIGTGAPGGYELSLSSGGIVFIRLNGGTTSTTRLDSSISYPIDGNTWMHIAATTNGTAIKVYINGALNTSKTLSPFTINTNATNIGIGAEPATTPLNYFLGTIDDARIYNRALSDVEIAALASATPPGDTTAPAAPTALNAVAGDTIVNLTWTAPADPDVKGYNVYRGTTSHTYDPTPINGVTLVTTESYADTSVSSGTLYYYTVKAMDTSNHESAAADPEASATPYGNVAPIVTDIPGQTIDEGDSFVTISLDDYVSDADNTDAEMNWTHSGETDLSVSIVSRVATISVPNADWNGSETITFRATDPGALYDEDAASFTVSAVNDAPVCVDVTLTTAEDTPGDTAPDCTDADTGDTLTYSIVDDASDGSASVVAGSLHYDPNPDFNGPDSFTYKANDTHVDSNTSNVAVTVTAVSEAPEVTNPGTQSSAEGDVISLQIVATDEDGPALAYSALALPAGLSIHPTSGLISGTITYHAAANSPYSASVTVTDGTTPVTVNFTWNVTQTAFGACAGETGLVGCWEMEEGSGTAIIDGSAVGNDGTTTGAPGWVTGKTGALALSLNGTSQSASVPDADSLDLTTAFTIAGWIKPGKLGTQDLFKKADINLTNGYEIGLSGSSNGYKVLFRINQLMGPDSYRINSTTSYPSDGNTWMHVAATYSGGTMKLYINGVQEGGDLAAPTPAVNTLPFTLGTQVTGPRYYQGAMDDVRLYDRALTLEEIQVLAGLNIAPVVADIPDQTVDEGTSFTSINLDDYVSDVDNTDAQMTWTYSGNASLSVNIVDRVATISTPNADWNGSETITFRATDPGLLYAEDAATFTVNGVNDAPVVADIPDQTVDEGTSFATINLDDYVADVDNNDTQMSWTYSGNASLTVNIVDRVATISIPGVNWNGSETITFKATDPGLLFDEDAATFTVSAVNDPPVVTDIPGQSITEGNSFASINLDDYVSDIDNSDTQMTWTYSGNTALSVDIDVNRVATISTPNADWNGSETITFKAADPGTLWDDDTATFTVNGVNDAPVVADIPDQTVDEGASFATINLDDYVADVDNADSQMIWSYSGNSLLSVAIDLNRVATISIPGTEWNGSETITFKATDPDELWDDDAATFTVSAVNDTPVVTDIPDQSITEGNSFATINLDDYVSDIDNNDTQMTWTYSGNTALSVDIDVNRVATISTPNADWNGSETITFRAADPGLLYDEDAASFTVSGVNDAPVVADIPDQTVDEGASFATINLDDYVADVDNSDAQMGWTYSGNTLLSVAIDVNRVATISIPGDDWNGSEMITFRATDPDELWDEDAATFTVSAVNDTPVVTDIPDQTIDEGASFTTINLDDYVSDVDNSDAQMTWSYSGNASLTVNIVARVATISIPNADWNGSETITFKAADPGTLWDDDTASFTVSAVNDAPVVTDIPDQIIPKGASFTTINLDGYVADIDNSDAEMGWTYSGNTDLTITIIDGVATISIPGVDWIGSESITFTATDPGLLHDEDAATFTVTDVNFAPVVTDIPNQVIDEGDSFTTISLDNYVSDPNNTDSEMDWSYSGNIFLSVDIDVNRVATITPPDADWNGSETITFKATDPGALWDEDAATFTVYGSNDAPVLGAIGPQNTAELVELSFTATATDIDLPADTLNYSLADGSTGSVPAGAGIGSSSGDFSWTPTEAQGPDTYTFDVCVSDGLLSDCETISVTVSEVATAPVAVPDAYDVLVNGTLIVSAPGVLANDSDVDIPADTLTASLDTSTAHGHLTFETTGSFTYTPDALWSGIDSFTYRAYDGSGYSEEVTVTITVKLMKFYIPMIIK